MSLRRPRALAHLCLPLLLVTACAASDAGREEPLGPDAGPSGPSGPGAPDAGSTAGADASSAPSAADAAPAPVDAAPPAATLTAEQQALLAAINAERAAVGVAPVAIRADLLCAAQAHSDDIGAAAVCQINGAGGATPEDRVVACSGPSLAATLIGCGYLSGSATAAGWAADGDIGPILRDPQLKFVGVGEHNRYWTAIFDR